MSSDRTTRTALLALGAIQRELIHCSFTGPVAVGALDYLDAIIPPNHAGRSTLLELLDAQRRQRSHGHELPREHHESRLDRLAELINSHPLTGIVTVQDPAGIAAINGDWHESGITFRIVGVFCYSDGGGGEIDNAFGAGHMEPTMVLCKEGEPIAQANIADILRFAAMAAPGGRWPQF